ncbi:TetR/AcrR family transcriptional regulator [Pediococcus damnosus]|uniref:TetR/AcrR family transcriptional regulator n=1 Tax=Pediococcus damnosus TaxID=51663 RepID=UPI00130E7DA5|nr:TetR/AcrR family transcriptional regulator [Pediococcus damnosus]
MEEIIKKRILNEERVLTAATELAAESGFEAITLSRVAKRLDIQPQSMYRYTKNTEDLRAKVFAKSMQELVDYLYQSLIGLSGTTALEQLTYTVAFGEYSEVIPHDFAAVSKYLKYPDVATQYNRLYAMLPLYLAQIAHDPEIIRRGTSLLSDFMLGESVNAHNNGADNIEVRQADFRKNVTQILGMLAKSSRKKA